MPGKTPISIDIRPAAIYPPVASLKVAAMVAGDVLTFLRLYMPDGKLNDYSHAPPLGGTQSGGGEQSKGPLFSAEIGC